MFSVLLLISIVSGLISIPLKSKLRAPIQGNFGQSLISQDSTVFDSYSLEYYADFELGTPGQKIAMFLDTGSTWTWAPSVNCDCHSSENRFNSTLSSTFADLNKTVEIYYEIGYAGGQLATDKLSIGDLSTENMAFVLVNKDSDDMESDGLVGLAFSELSDGYSTFIENLVSQGEIDAPIFAFYFSDNEVETSVLTLGGFDSTWTEGKTKQTISINKTDGYWGFNVDSVSYSGEIISSETHQSILDTGTSAICIPKNIYQNVINSITKGKNCVVIYDNSTSCECVEGEYNDYEKLSIKIGQEEFLINPKNYLFYENGTCNILLSESSDEWWIIGQPIFREYYTVHDMSVPKIDLYKVRLDSSNFLWYIAAGCAAALIVIVIIVATCMCGRKDPKAYHRLTVDDNALRGHQA
ncbi:hypothetical protein SteCoe_32995 [Stentor coeruleus]|uniref:Peptidase A1 domain-containing protein n=1 Tax=Stentor coeruleus TaxID=5963 RepID=A0A1R2AXS0_9CILI|nr:hypothetical protein SteCoe_32995 [Stentor coeruleus]